MELGIPYELVGPDGTRIVFGNDDAAQADPDWVGFVDPDSQIVGLDGAEVRESADDLPEQDGGAHGDFYEGRRPVVINLILDPRADYVGLERRIKRATRALRDDAELRWTPTDLDFALRLRLRRQAKPTIADRRPKKAQLAMVSADSLTRSAVEEEQLIPPSGGSIVGYTAPYSSPYGTEAAEAAQSYVVNRGDIDALWRARIFGPIVNPVLVNNTTDQALFLNYTLAAGQAIELDAGRRSAELLTPLAYGAPENRTRNPRPGSTTGWAGGAYYTNGPEGSALAFITDTDGRPALRFGTDAAPGWQGVRDTSIAGDTFVGGVTYYFVIDAKAAAAGQAELFFGAGAPEPGSVVSVNLGTEYQTFVVAWTPAADRTGVAAGIRSPAAGAAMTISFRRVLVGTDPVYFDGSSPGHRWQGAADNSVSDTITVYDRANRFGAIVFPDSRWFRLIPGANDIRLLATSADVDDSQAVMYWRHAFE